MRNLFCYKTNCIQTLLVYLISNIYLLRQTTGGSMNPIRTLGPAVAAGNYKGLWIYLVAPTLGALAGAATYTAVKLPHNQV